MSIFPSLFSKKRSDGSFMRAILWMQKKIHEWKLIKAEWRFERRHKEAWRRIREYKARKAGSHPAWQPRGIHNMGMKLPRRLILSLKDTGGYKDIHNLGNRYSQLSLAVTGKITPEELAELERDWAEIVNGRKDIFKGLSREEIINHIREGLRTNKGGEKVIALRKKYSSYEDREMKDVPLWANKHLEEYHSIIKLIFTQKVPRYEKMSQDEREEQFCGFLSKRLLDLAHTGRVTQEEYYALFPMLQKNRWA